MWVILEGERLWNMAWSVPHQAPLSVKFSMKNAGVSSHSLLQGILLTQELNPGVLHCRQILNCLNHQESPSFYGQDNFLGRRAITNLDSILKSRGIILPTKVCTVRAVVFSSSRVWMWAIKKVEPWRTDAFKLWCWRRLLREPWTARRSNLQGN